MSNVKQLGHTVAPAPKGGSSQFNFCGSMLCELIEIHAVYFFLNVLSKNLKHELNYILLVFSY